MRHFGIYGNLKLGNDMKSLLLLSLVLLLSGCANGSFSDKRDLDNGSQQPGVKAFCNGMKSWSDCEKIASQACPNGYEILQKDENLTSQNRYIRYICK
jgi:hypothetical protein